MAEDERLAAMFNKNMSLDPPPPPPQEPQKIVYISQHYTHTAHITNQTVEPPQLSPRPASEPSQSDQLLVETVLRNHGVDPSHLSTSQLQLIRGAEENQQLRLIELWRICPPSNNEDHPSFAWDSNRTVDQEIALAENSYMRKMAGQKASEQQGQQQAAWQAMEQQSQQAQELAKQRAQQQEEDQTMMSLDGTPLVPMQGGDSRWMGHLETSHYMEPYMMSGYQAPDVPRLNAYKQATDPVYNSQPRELSFSQIEELENQYGRMVDQHGWL
ncbi:hypothetical protein GE09DRAFT_1227101 [Coniochaeta sp. 2T2.1]|nr:hypothetical protein GE09DRAFT_1227101 [Coniochaeta sp. 2T2.1]